MSISMRGDGCHFVGINNIYKQQINNHLSVYLYALLSQRRKNFPSKQCEGHFSLNYFLVLNLSDEFVLDEKRHWVRVYKCTQNIQTLIFFKKVINNKGIRSRKFSERGTADGSPVPRIPNSLTQISLGLIHAPLMAHVDSAAQEKCCIWTGFVPAWGERGRGLREGKKWVKTSLRKALRYLKTCKKFIFKSGCVYERPYTLVRLQDLAHALCVCVQEYNYQVLYALYSG